MAATIAGVFQPEMQNIIKESKVLLVGAGGIGCEVLKNLVLVGFGELDVIDLDTIEVSNLNRQFLFNKESVGKAKSHVAKNSVLKFNPNVNITAHFGDIMDTKYGMAFFNKFKLVINALDNKKARSHVNRMCLSCQIPLIESGTMGYSGQVEFIKKGLSMCYECYPRSEPKSYPICTIRNTPKEPIHCIVWAKFLFGQLFGESDEDVSMDEVSNNGYHRMSARDWAICNDYNSKKLLKKLFFDDIKYLLSMPGLYAEKNVKPILLDESIFEQGYVKYNHVLDSDLLSLEQCVSMFLDCVTSIRLKLRQSPNACLVWDKDDDDFMNFVVSCSNIRSAIFNIPFKSHFDIKSMAGNIVPAIATANAMVAGQIVIHALRILRGKFDRCQSIFLRGMPNHKGGILVKDKHLQKPNEKCSVCSTEGEILLCTDVNYLTVRQFEVILKKKLNMVAPDVMVDGKMIISSDEADEVDLFDKTLIQLGINDGSRFSVDDFFQNYSISIMLCHREKSDEDPDYEIFNNVEDLNKAYESKNKTKSHVNDDDCIIEKAESSAGSSECDNIDTGRAVDDVIMNEEENEKEVSIEEDTEKIGIKEDVEEISNKEGDAEEIGNKEGDAEEINNKEGDVEEIGNKEGDAEKISNKEGDAEEIGNKEGDEEEIGDKEGDAEEIGNKEGDEEEIGDKEGDTEEIGNKEGDEEEIDNKGDAEDISNEEILAIKRKADEAIEDINDAKKSRVD